jgi:hypothetical protein
VKTIIKLVIAAVIINAAVRVGMAYASYYQLRDAAQQLVTFGAQASTDEIQNQIVMKAQTLNLPLDPANVTVQRTGPQTSLTTAYTQDVQVFPNYVYPMAFKFSVDAVNMAGLGANPGQARE